MRQKLVRPAAALIAAVFLSGCAGITAPTAEELIKEPLRKGSLRIGMTKEHVESLWGKPDEKRIVEDTDKWAGSRELWVYRARTSVVPIDLDYLSKTKKLYFDQERLTNIEEER
jgi:hypothetical protein